MTNAMAKTAIQHNKQANCFGNIATIIINYLMQRLVKKLSMKGHHNLFTVVIIVNI